MGRWLAYSGSPIRLDELLYKPRNSLINQSMRCRLGREPANGEGFGVGWYAVDTPRPTLFRGVGPAWSDPNLRELSRSVSSPLFLAHITASTGTPVRQTNCHPFRYERWLWAHNGAVREYPTLRRDLTFAVDPGLHPNISGSTDSEVMFHLALTFGLQDDPVLAVERLVGFIESVGRRHGVARPLQMTVGTTDGDRVWAFRYSSERNSRSLYFSTAVSALRDQYPDNENLHWLSEESRIVVSEPLGELEGAWQPIPECGYGVAQKGADWLCRLRPKAP